MANGALAFLYTLRVQGFSSFFNKKYYHSLKKKKKKKRRIRIKWQMPLLEIKVKTTWEMAKPQLQNVDIRKQF
jgi:hypothetical protein